MRIKVINPNTTASMTRKLGAAAGIEREIGMPVIDGVGAAVKFVEALVGLGLRTSKVGDPAYPRAKPYAGVLAPFAPLAVPFSR